MAATKTTKAIIELAAEVKASNAEAKNNEMKNEENRREMVSLLSDIRDGILSGAGGGGGGAEKVVEAEGKKMKIPLSTILGAAVASLAFIPGLFMGFFGDKGLGGQLKKLFPKTSAKVSQFFTRISTFFKNLGTKIAKPFKAIGGRVSNFTKSVGSQVDDSVKGIRSIFANIKSKFTQNKAVKAIGRFVGELGDDFKKLGNLFKNLKGGTGGGGKGLVSIISKITTPVKAFFGTIGKFFTPFKSFIGTVSKLAPKFLAIGKTVGGIAGKLFLPITILMGAFDGIKGFISGFKGEGGNVVQKVVSGLGGAISGILGGLIGMPLDLLKKGVGFIMGLFGFDKGKEALESFSFKDLIDKVIKAPINLINKAIDFIVALFKDPKGTLSELGGKIKDSVSKVLKSVLRFILPRPKPDASILHPANMISKVIPESVYKFAGIDKSTGEDIPEPLTDAEKFKQRIKRRFESDPFFQQADEMNKANIDAMKEETEKRKKRGRGRIVKAYGVEFEEGVVGSGRKSDSGAEMEAKRKRNRDRSSTQNNPQLAAMARAADKLERRAAAASRGGGNTNVSNTHVHGQKGNSAAQKLQLAEAESF
jgi:hypothetical protein